MKFTRLAIGLALAGLSFGANATNGMFGHGYGMKAKGMGGAATATAEDAFGGANNPASMAFVGNRIDFGADLFSPIRESTSTLTPFGTVNMESNSNYFVIPEFGYNRMINSNLSLGVSVYGNGGMNTDYDPVPGAGGFNLFGGTGSLGIDLMQLIIAPTAAYKLTPDHAIGISPLLAYQRFRSEGLQSFGIINPGYDDSFGYGVRVGYQGRITPTVAIGAAYSTKVNYDEFDKYNLLFLENGDLDIPANYNLGVAWQATPQLMLALDYQRINYSDVDSMGKPPAVGGFGWDDSNVWKLGAKYKYNNKWTFRAGYSHTDSPIEGATLAECGAGSVNCGETFFNTLAPGIIEDHATLGFTYTTASGGELTVAYMHGFKNDVSGANPFGGDTTIQMYQNSLGIAYGWKM